VAGEGAAAAWNGAELEKLAWSATLLRLADANRDGTRLYANSGEEIAVGSHKASNGASRGAIVRLDDRGKFDLNAMAKEIEDVDISFQSAKGTRCLIHNESVEANISRAIIFGEKNINSMALWPVDKNTIRYVFDIADFQSGQGCTAAQIMERVNEIRFSKLAEKHLRIELAGRNRAGIEGFKSILRTVSSQLKNVEIE
jgi:hypothetical protein